MNFGRFHQGREVLLKVHVRKPDGTAADADALPAVSVHDGSGARLLSELMPPLDRYKASGLFGYRLFLGSSYPAGKYLVSFRWKSAGAGRLKAAVFEVVAGGDPAGCVVSQYSLERPHAKFLCQKTDGNKRYHKRNPYL